MFTPVHREKSTNEPPQTIGAVEQTFGIIQSLSKHGDARIRDLRTDVPLTDSAIHKHLTTLQQLGFVSKAGKHYRLSFQFLNLGGTLRRRLPKIDLIKKKVWEVAVETEEVAQFFVPEQGCTVAIFRESGRQGVPTRVHVGKYLPLHQNAAGKVILSELPEHEVKATIQEISLASATENTINSQEQLFTELEQIKEQGYALNFEETTAGVTAISASVTLPEEANESRIYGAISVAGPSHRMKEERVHDEIAPLLLSTINELELSITHS